MLGIRRNNETKLRKILKIWKKILVRPKKKGPYSYLVEKFGKILKIRKNTPRKYEKILGIRKKKVLTQIWLKNSEKYSEYGKILQKIRKNTPENSEKYTPKHRILEAKSLFSNYEYNPILFFLLPVKSYRKKSPHYHCACTHTTQLSLFPNQKEV